MNEVNQQQKSYKIPQANFVILVGSVTKEPDLRRTINGKAYCAFDIAIGRRMKDTTTGEAIFKALMEY